MSKQWMKNLQTEIEALNVDGVKEILQRKGDGCLYGTSIGALFISLLLKDEDRTKEIRTKFLEMARLLFRAGAADGTTRQEWHILDKLAFRIASINDKDERDSLMEIAKECIVSMKEKTPMAGNGWHSTAHTIVSRKNWDLLKLLLENGLNPNVKCKGEGDFPLFVRLGATGGRAELALLAQYGSFVGARGNGGESALHLAASKGNIQGIESLVNDFGIDPSVSDDRGLTPLHEAINGGWVDAAKKLVNFGAQTDFPSGRGLLTTFIASGRASMEMFDFLINEVKCPPKESDNWTEMSDLLYAVDSWTDFFRNNIETVIKKFLEKGANINATNPKGETALMLAAKNGRTNVIKVLLENGADVEIRDKRKLNALRHAGKETESYRLILAWKEMNVLNNEAKETSMKRKMRL